MTSKKYDFRLVADRALQSIDSVLDRWVPGGKRQGGEYVVPNPTRSDNNAGSFTINLNSGVWKDFATGDGGGDLVALVAYVENSSPGEAHNALASFLGLSLHHQDTNQHDESSKARAHKKPPPTTWKPILPAPPEALKTCPTKHPKLGTPSRTWDYLDASGQLLMRVLRFDKQEGKGKEFRPLTYGEDGNRNYKWAWKQLSSSRPLYGLQKLSDFSISIPVILTEGEKACDAAQTLFPSHPVLTWPNGSQSISKADFRPLAGRSVWYWPDADQAGADSVAKLRNALGVAGVTDFIPFDTSQFARFVPGESADTSAQLNQATPAHSWPEKADAADAVEMGWNAEHIALLIDEGLVPKVPTPEAKTGGSSPPASDGKYRAGDDGIWCMGKDHAYQYVGAPLSIVARSRDMNSEGWGLLVEFADHDGHIKEWNIPGAFLHTEGGNKAVEGLIYRGYKLAGHRGAKDQLREYLAGHETRDRVRLVNRMGWHGEGAFMLPNQVIGSPREPLHYYSDAPPLCKIAQSGTFEDWRDNIAAYCSGNSLLTFAMCVAFCGPLMDVQATESCGFHFFGDSSLGKSTLLKVAASVYGNPATGEYTKTWRTTDNALESMAAAHSDCLLVLDEIGQIEPRIVGETIYSLGSGVGKSRATETGAGRGTQHKWRVMFLSSGEKTLTDHMAEANKKPQAGMELRLLTIPANPHQDPDTATKLGNFETDHGFGGGAALSNHLNDQALKHHGHAAVLLINWLVSIDRNILSDRISKGRESFKFQELATSSSGQADRAADKFSLVAAAGELATEAGITGWAPGWATDAAALCFRRFLSLRGGAGNLEDKKALDHVRSMLTKYGESRFTRWESEGATIDEHGPRTMERWGFRKTIETKDSMDGDTTETLFFLRSPGMKAMCPGFDIVKVASVLHGIGALEVGKDKKRYQVKKRLPGDGDKARYTYVINSSVIFDDDNQNGEPDGTTSVYVPGFDD